MRVAASEGKRESIAPAMLDQIEQLIQCSMLCFALPYEAEMP